MDLDEMLRDSAPDIAGRNAELQSAVDGVLAHAETQARPSHARRRIALVTATAIGSIGVTTAAATAVGIIPAWVPWSTGSGNSCHMQFSAHPRGSEGEPATTTYTTQEQQRAAEDAARFLSSLDYSSIDEDRAIAEWKSAEDSAIESQSPDEQQPRLTGDDLALSAVGRVVWMKLDARLRADGFARPADAVTFGQAWKCE